MMRFDFIERDVVQDDKGWEGGLLMYNQESDRSVSTLKESVYTHSRGYQCVHYYLATCTHRILYSAFLWCAHGHILSAKNFVLGRF